MARDSRGRFTGGGGGGIRTPEQYQAHAALRQRTIDKHLRLGFRFATTKVLTYWRGFPDFPIQTGNLQHSVGANRLIAASRTTLGDLPAAAGGVSTSDLVRKRGTTWRILLPVGMEYAPHLVPRLHVPEVLAYARQQLAEAFQKSMRNAMAELGS